ncbi:nitroreductase family deazaflavin-dependent oxidoreductase [Pseudactinotalea suaedae]|uniref:nitroreductase family deazaflavin-dependent oxidoreductase n=1 Tax=Pseudactinotalea suaedae TaxID=1524924 RepID=UPI0012E19426|nr:nitroreductase family deazaflavin-dependent oxidoreductase [Pseudactinotalea suaedae]
MSEERQYRPPASEWVRDQVKTIEATGDTTGVLVQGRPVVVVEILGARSGLWRKVPLMRVEHDGVYVAVASKGGAPEHPAWFHSLTVNPDVTIQDGTEFHEARARLVTGAERAEWWPRCVEAFPSYASYQSKTEREIPVFLLEPR